MKAYKSLIVCLIVANSLFAQSVQWASKVVKFSSEHSDYWTSANQALGFPNSIRGAADYSWSPKKDDGGNEFIHVEFQNPIYVKQFAIIEALNTGAIAKVELYEPNGKSHKVYEKTKFRAGYQSIRMFSKKIPRTSYLVIGLKVTLNTKAISGPTSIDAIAISDSDQRITVEIDSLIYSDLVEYPENLGISVNSGYAERTPVIAPDGNTLYFTRKYHPENMGAEYKDDVWMSKYGNDETWKMAVNVGPPINNDKHNFVVAISPDNRYIYLGGGYKRWEKDYVSIAKIKGNKWGEPRPLEIENMYNKSPFASYHVNVDGNILLMAIEREDTYGDRDLYVSFRKGRKWTAPMNLGVTVNSQGMESGVFLAADNRTLYYSSSGLPGYGGLDMFVTRRLDDTWTNWSPPKNLGSEINTRGNDFNYTIPASGEYAYFSSSYKSYGKAGYSDLFRIRLPEEARPDAVPLVTLIEQGYAEDDNFTGSDDEGTYVYTPPTPPSTSRPSAPTTSDSELERLRAKYNRTTTTTPNTPQNVPQEYNRPDDPELAKLREKYNRTLDKDQPESLAVEPQRPVRTDPELEALRKKYQKATTKETPQTPTPPATGGFVTETEVYDEPIKDEPKANTGFETETIVYDEPKKNQEQPVKTNTGGFETETTVYDEPITKPIPETPTTPIPPTNNGFETETTVYEQTETPEIPQKTREELENELREEVRAQLRTELLDDVVIELEGELEGNVKENLKDNLKDDVAKELENELRETVRDDLKDNLKDDVARELEDELRKEIIASLRKELYDDVKRELRQKLRDQIRKELEEQIRKELEAEIRRELEAEQAKKERIANNSTETNEPKNTDDWLSRPIEVGQIIPMDQLFFEVNKATIKEGSYKQLNDIITFLNTNPNVVIEIGGHSNGLASNEYAIELSTGRAKAVADYLVQQGLSKKRIQYHGYGKSHPIASNATAAGRKKNQRVELKVLEIVD